MVSPECRIPSDRWRVWPRSARGDYGVMVERWNFIDPPSGTGTHPYVIGTDAIDLNGVAGQGNDNPPGIFTGHWITECLGTYYDPSYGTDPVPDPGKDKAYEDGAFAGFSDFYVVGARKNDRGPTSPAEVDYYLAP